MKNIFSILLLFFTSAITAQDNQLWEGYFSYNAVKDLSSSNTQLFGAAENAYFKRSLTSDESKKVSTIDGLSGQTITQIYHSKTFRKTLIGHSDGLLVIVNEDDGKVLNVVDILNKPSISPVKKRINHFVEHQGKVYISTDFGICVYNLNILEFGDTYFIGAGGANIEIFQTTVFNGFIYAVANGYGLLRADVTSPNLIDFNQWTLIYSASLLAVDNTGLDLVVVTTNSILYKFVGNTITFVANLPSGLSDMRFSDSQLILTFPNSVRVFNTALIQTYNITGIPNIVTQFTCATILNSKLYIGTEDQGVFSAALNNLTNFENITPKGPFRNRIFAAQTFSDGIWCVYGDYSASYNPYPLDLLPISKYSTTTNNWLTLPYNALLNAKSIVRIAVNPKNEKQVLFSSNYSGVLKLENEVPNSIFNATNSSMQTIIGQVPDDVRANGSGFDKKGDFWVTNSIVDKSLHVLRSSGQWEGYKLTSMQALLSASYGRLAIDKNNTKWICTNFEGLVGFNEAYNNKSINIREGQGEGNLPSRDVRAVAVDNNNKLWIGTIRGLRILSSTDAFITQNQLETQSIIILDDNLAQELLFEQSITDIVVDGANNKWIGTAGAGVFFVSSDGQKTFNIFTKENSPLPSNIITDIDINPINGEVYMVTEGGMVSYKGNATTGADNLANVIIYPNPVRPQYAGFVTITGLTNKANVKITDIEGNLVYETISEGGTILWDTQAFGKYKVASGVYMVFISSDDGLETKIKKVMIVR